MTGLEREASSSTVPRFLTHRNYGIVDVRRVYLPGFEVIGYTATHDDYSHSAA